MIILFVLVWAIVIIGLLPLSAFFLMLFVKLLSKQKISFWRSLLILVLMSVSGFLISLILSALGGKTVLTYIVDYVLILVIFYWLLKKYVKVSFLKSVLIYFISSLATGLLFILPFVVRIYLFQPFIMDGQSMEPALGNNAYLVTDKISYKTRDPKQGEIIIVRPPDNPGVHYVKRIIGVPGDKVEIKDNSVFINGSKLNEPYLANNTKTQTPDSKPFVVTLKQDEYFVLGDNREHSRDSRELGPIPKTNIVSRVDGKLF